MHQPARHTFVTDQQAVIHALFRKHRSMSVVARTLNISQIRVREALVQHQRNTMRDAGQRPPPLKEMLRGDVTTRFGVSRCEFGGRPAKHVQLQNVAAPISSEAPDRRGYAFARDESGTRRLIVTSVEPDAPLHQGFWNNLQAFAAVVGSEIVVVRLGSVTTKRDLAAAYQGQVIAEPLGIDGVLDVASDDVPPCRLSRPLDAVRHRNAARWTIVPHAAVQLETLPRIRMDGLKAQLTTGAMTRPVRQPVSERREVGAVIAEVSAAGAVHCRHLLSPADGDGSFHDLDIKVANGSVRKGIRAEAITFGDIHHMHMDAAVAAATWGIGDPGGTVPIVDRLRPRAMVFHDVCDFDARNSYDARDNHKRFEQLISGTGDVRAELTATALFLADTRRSWARSVVVGSNHDAALVRWLREQDYRDDPGNALFYLETALALYRRLADGRGNDDFFEQTLRNLCPDGLRGVRFLRCGESLKLAGIEASIHGHLGADGRPGDMRFFERLGVRATLGHTHRPTTRDGVYSAGVCNTELAYARGSITAWAVGHVVSYANGTRQHLIFDGGSFHG